MRKGLIGVFSSALLCMLAADATATSVRRLTNEALTDAADTIVVGRAVQHQSAWVDRSLVTLVTLEVKETLKGTADPTLVVALPGGIDAQRKFPVAVTVPGAPTIAPNEEVLLFLVDGQDIQGAYSIAGFTQGKYSVVEADGVQHVARDLTQVDVHGGSGVARGTRTLEKLSSFREEIRRYLTARGEGQ